MNYAKPTSVSTEFVVPQFIKSLENNGKVWLAFPFICVCQRNECGKLRADDVKGGRHIGAKLCISFMTLTPRRPLPDADEKPIGYGVVTFPHTCFDNRSSKNRWRNMELKLRIIGSPSIVLSCSRFEHYEKGIIFQAPEFTIKKVQSPGKGYINDADGSLRVKCELVYQWKNADPKAGTNPLYIHHPITDVMGAMQSAYDTQNYIKDVTLEAADGTKIETSKFMLSARSEVFLAMFQHDTLEQSSNYVKIPDADGEMLEHLVKYMFTGTFTRSAAVASRLFLLADKYLMNNLKNYCATTLLAVMSEDNVLETMAIADQHGLDDLKEEAFKYVCKLESKPSALPSWQKVKEERPQLLDALVDYMQEYGRHTARPTTV